MIDIKSPQRLIRLLLLLRDSKQTIFRLHAFLLKFIESKTKTFDYCNSDIPNKRGSQIIESCVVKVDGVSYVIGSSQIQSSD